MGIEVLRAGALTCAALTPPAVAVFRHLGRGLRLTERVLLGLALAPLALALPALGLALAVDLRVGWCLWPSEFIWTVVALWPRSRRDATEPGAAAEPLPERGHGFPAIAAITSAVLAAVLVGGVALSVPFVRMWSDAWFHAAAAVEIHIRGVPPQDPNFAGIPLYYPWFFHVVIVLLGAINGATAFDQMAFLNVWSAVVLVLAVAQISHRAFGRPAAMWAGAIAVLGLDPFGWLYMVGRAMVGETRGFSEMIAGLTSSNGATVQLSYLFPPSHVSLLNRFWTGTALTPAIALGATAAWSVTRVLERPSRAGAIRTLVIMLAAFAFHPAYTAIAGACMAAGIAWVMLTGQRRGPGAAALAVLAVALALAIPYVRVCEVPGATTALRLGLYHRNVWSLLLAVGPWWLIAVPVLGALRQGSDAARFAAAAAIATVVGAIVIVMPEFNTDKLFYLAWVSLVPLLAAGWVWWGNRLKLPTMARATLLAALVVPTAGLYALGTALDPRSPGVLIRGDTPSARNLPLATPAEEEGYRYLRDRTPDETVVIERPRPTVNEPVPVLGQRPVFCGSLNVYLANHFDDGRTTDRAMLALREEFGVRRAIQIALFSTGVLDDQQRLYLNGFTAPIYLLVRRREVEDAVWDGFRVQPAWVEEFANEEMRIFRFRRPSR